ncbi:MAG TPA: alpha/beta hydrolase, partial [Candidatus Limnocylindria bacterium]|nr:alpha/beta hydrolase [Candidatus Limnocylindria bacterium]
GKVWRTAAIALAAVLALLMGAPYLVPLSAPPALAAPGPFNNSATEVVRGTPFHFRTYAPQGAVSGKLLLVHGLGGSTFSFEEAAPALAAQGLLVVSVDLPGFGYSARDPAYDHSQANRARDVWALLDALDATLEPAFAAAPWFLGGHSMGGGTVAAMAMADAPRTRGLVLIDAALFETPRSEAASFPPVLRWTQVVLERFLINERNIARMLASAYGREPTAEQVQGYLAPLRLPGTARALRNFVLTSRNEDPSRLAGLGVPILAVWGSEDAWVPITELDRLRELVPEASAYIVQGAGHCPMETHPEEFVAAVWDWMSGLE